MMDFTTLINEIRSRPYERSLARELLQMDARAGPGLCVGRILQIPHADDYAYYRIEEIGDEQVRISHIPLRNAYRSSLVSADNTVPRYFAEQRIEWADTIRAMVQDTL